MKMRRSILMFGLICVSASLAAAADNLSATLQKALFEEEANHNLPAAIKAYQSVLQQADEQRKLAATAVFRLGECYRKLGQTNEAAAQYQRLLRDYGDQTTLANLSQQNLVGLGVAAAAPGKPSEAAAATDEEEREVRRIQALIKDSPDLINAKASGREAPLNLAAAKGQIVVARFLLANKADINLRGSDNWNPLHRAAAAGHKSMTELLLASGADVNAAMITGATPLHLAVEYGYQAVAEVLLTNHANPNLRNLDGRTPLHHAADKGFQAIAEMLLANGAEVEVKENRGWTPLHVAADKGNAQLAAALLAHQAAVDPRTTEGVTPLLLAAIGGHLPVIELLLAQKAEVNAGTDIGITPLITAIINFNGPARLPVIETLLAKGANPNARTKDGTTPLWLAVGKGSAEVTRALLDAKADPNAPGPQNGWTPLPYAIDKGQQAIAELLLKHGADANLPVGTSSYRNYSGPGFTPLLIAVIQGNGDLVKLLLQSKANPNLKLESGRAPLHLAIQESKPAIAQALLEAGADGEAKTPEGDTPLAHAIRHGSKEIIELLIAHKVNVNARSDDGLTPLHKALGWNHGTAFNLLLAAKADVNATDPQGRTPLDYVKQDVTLGPRPPGSMPQPLRYAVPPGVLPGRPPVLSTPLPLTSRQAELADALRQSGAIEWAPRPGQITMVRRSTGAMVSVFRQGTNGLDRHTLLEAIAATEWGSSSKFQFPDFAAIKVVRRNSKDGGLQETPVDLTPVLAGDCAGDLPLEWGDLVDLPERTHKLDEFWNALPADFSRTVTNCLKRTITLTVAGQTTNLTITAQLDGYGKAEAGGKPFLSDRRKLGEREIMVGYGFDPEGLRLLPMLKNSGLLLSSSDLARVKVQRTDPVTGRTQEQVFNLEKVDPATDLWLRDGDIIEVPEKGQPFAARAAGTPARIGRQTEPQ